MFKIAIVEDDANQSKLLNDYIVRFSKEHGKTFDVATFYNAQSFLNTAQRAFDIIFMDIELPDGNGMEVVRKLRETDKETLVIFVTNLAQFAVKGYEVKAFDFVIKPIAYYNFELKFLNALDSVKVNKDIDIWIKYKGGKICLNTSRITYIDVVNHYVTYHTLDADYEVLNSINNVALELEGLPFSFCNQCYLVNLKFVKGITPLHVIVNGEKLLFSRRRRTAFLKDLDDYLAGGK